MRYSRIPSQSAVGLLTQSKPDLPVLFFDPQTLRATYTRFIQGFPGLVTYAVKANDSLEVLENLVVAGMTTFDVASPAEMARVRQVCPQAVLHYNNPVRSRAEVASAVAMGVASYSVDCPSELQKLADGGARGEVSVRLALPVSGAAYDFGEKFGADPDLCVALLQQAQSLGFTAAMTFHPGTQCDDPQAWARYIEVCAQIAARAGVPLARLNVGGGYASHRKGHAPDLEAIFAQILRSVTQAFGPNAPALVCEPGRAMVAESYQMAVRVKAIKGADRLYLNDGIYGGMAEWRDIGDIDRHAVLSTSGVQRMGAHRDFTLFGPTCDSLDKIPDRIALPSDVQEEDYILLAGMGAYSTATSTAFNGYGELMRVTLG